MNEREELAALRRLAELEAKAAGQPVAVQAGKEVNQLGRQAGLTARYGIEGLANAAQLVTEPIRAVTDRVFGQTGRTVPLGVMATRAADALGLPSPQGANERVVGDAARLMAGAGGMGAAAGAPVQIGRQVISLASSQPALASQTATATGRLLPDVLTAVRSAPNAISQNMGAQVASAAGAGMAGGSSREAGGSPMEQGLAALAGGIGGGMAVQTAGNMARTGANWLRNQAPGQQQLIQQRLDQRINITLQQQGIDPATITPAMRTAMREQVQQALNTGGDLNPEALARLADYTRLGMTPTRARLTLDPFDVTQEQNVSRLAAASGSRDARLPAIAQGNNQRLIGLIDEMGGNRPIDRPAQGAAVTGSITARDTALNRDVRAAYDAFRESTGRELPIPLGPMRQGYNEVLRTSEDLIPATVRNRFEEVLSPPRPPHQHGAAPAAPQPPQTIVDQSGNVLLDLTPRPTPRTFSIEQAEDLIKNVINRHYNPADLPQARALDDLRRAVERSIIGATEDGAGMEAATLANFARDSARQRFQWRESSPVIERALQPGANADTFVQNNIVSQSASFRDVATAAQTINQSPAARDAVRTAIVQKLKDSAIGKGGTSQTGNFSGRGMEAALKDIGDRKLGLFFSPEEVQTLHAMARTGSFETFQPRGSAVNNSNSGAAIGAMLMNLTDRVRPVVNRVPGAGPLVDWAVLNPLENIGVWAAQRPALNASQGLLMPQQRPPFGSSLLLPGAAVGGLLAAPQ